MARPTKYRKVCHFPKIHEFFPDDRNTKKNIVLTIDEFETIRLIDKEKLSQEECANILNVARTTIQKIYELARKKIANALVMGYCLKIEGGKYEICNGQNCRFANPSCKKQEFSKKYYKEKGENVMRIAITYKDGKIGQHFGHTEKFKIFDTKDNKIISSEIIDTNGNGHSMLVEMLLSLNVDALICGGIGAGAQTALNDVGIKLYGGVSGEVDEAINSFLSKNLKYNPNVKCSHHEREHEGTPHKCSPNGCEKHSK